MDDLDRIKQIVDSVAFTCPICESPLYVTDYGKNTLSFHCSSEKAKFWTFKKGSKGLMEAKAHWDASEREVSIEKKDLK
jgi:hypothetical protein